MQLHKDNYTITTDKSAIDIEVVHSFLANSYWAEGIPKETIERSIKGSLCFTILEGTRQVGFARVITDEATFAYLADVFILQDYRGRGLSKWLMDVIMNYPSLQRLRRFMLATRDAHKLYKQYGFASLTNIDRWMQVHNPNFYKK